MSEKLENLCADCPAAYALGVYTESLGNDSETPMSANEIAMRQKDAAKAGEVLNTVAGSIACKSLNKDLSELPATVPTVGSSELIALVSECPSFPGYIQERTA